LSITLAIKHKKHRNTKETDQESAESQRRRQDRIKVEMFLWNDKNWIKSRPAERRHSACHNPRSTGKKLQKGEMVKKGETQIRNLNELYDAGLSEQDQI